jgi:hypothetical protein
MKAFFILIRVFFLCIVFSQLGCEQGGGISDLSFFKDGGNTRDISVLRDYYPVKIEIMPLTEFVFSGDEENGRVCIKVYLSLLDSFGCQEKMSGMFRFELYERVLRSTDAKGKRLFIWPDFDLTVAEENNAYWRDFLRVYEFVLEYDAEKQRSYILEATYTSPSGKRLLDEFELKSQ